jgi:hypothetical protein
VFRITFISTPAAAAALLLAAAGCRSADSSRLAAAPAGPEPTIAAPVTAGSETGASPQTFDVVFMTFIPANYVAAPWMHPQSYVGANARRLVFSGDDRSYDVDAVRYRARQRVTIIADGAADADGLVEGTKQNLGGRTESFVASQALADGRIDDDDRDVLLGDAWRKHAEQAGPKPTYELTGTWDGYPAAELYVNRTPIFRRTPDAGPASVTDLLKLAPKVGDEKVELRGTLE